MKCNKVIYATILALLLATGCSEDTDTPEDKRSKSYLNKALIISSQKVIDCNGSKVIMPRTYAKQRLDNYILEIHLANRGKDLSKMSISNMQSVYRKCIRPYIMELIH